LARQHKLYINPEFAYFQYPNVQHNFLFNAELEYQYAHPTKRFTPLASVGWGYLLARQRQGGSVNLGTGDITYDVASIGYFLPTLNVGFRIRPKKTFGYYLKGFYGRKWSTQRDGSAFFGLENGIVLNLFKNPK